MKAIKIIKYALILSSLFVSDATFAQSLTAESNPTSVPSAVLPTLPNPPAIIASSPNEQAASTLDTTNQVYINQSGFNVNVNIQQTGVSDLIGSLSYPTFLRGDNQVLTVIQTGNTNNLQLGIIGNIGAGAGTTATIQQLGNGNYANIQCGTGKNDPNCNGLNLNDKFNGNFNTLNFHGSAANITQTVDIEGNNNYTNIFSNSPNSSQTLLFNGENNTINVNQTDAGGNYGHSLFANVIGSNNTLTVQQYGASETVINIQSTGSNGIFNIKTGH